MKYRQLKMKLDKIAIVKKNKPQFYKILTNYKLSWLIFQKQKKIKQKDTMTSN